MGGALGGEVEEGEEGAVEVGAYPLGPLGGWGGGEEDALCQSLQDRMEGTRIKDCENWVTLLAGCQGDSGLEMGYQHEDCTMYRTHKIRRLIPFHLQQQLLEDLKDY